MTKETKGKYEMQVFKNGETIAQSFYFDNIKEAEDKREFVLNSFGGQNPIVKIFNLENNIGVEFQKLKQEARERIAKIAGEDKNS